MKPVSKQPTLNVIKEGVTDNSCENGKYEKKYVIPGSPSDLARVKATASRLRLQTKRQSYIAWKANHYDAFFKDLEKVNRVNKDKLKKQTGSSTAISRPSFKTLVNGDDKLMSQSKEYGQIVCQGQTLSINQALLWIKKELQAMRLVDQAIAKQLLSLRHEIQDIRLKWSCEDHESLVEDMQIGLEELHALSEICDLPVELLGDYNPLKHWGVTKLNLNNRRFSTC